MKLKSWKNVRNFIVSSALLTLTMPVYAQNVVIALKTNPLVDPEAACVALQIGQNLAMDIGIEGAADKVTLFPTLDGVEIVSERMLLLEDLPNGKSKNYPPHLDCLTPNGYVPLPQLLAGFQSLPNVEIIVCPLCWGARYEGEDPIYGEVGDKFSIHTLFMDADKVIDF